MWCFVVETQTLWVDGIFDFPRDIAFIDRVSSELALAFESGKSVKPPTLSPFLIIGRNILFLIIVVVVSFTRQF